MPYAVITGATSGLGLAYANELAREKRNLILVARSAETLEEVSKKLSSEFGVVVLPFVTDLSDAEAVRNLAIILAEYQIDTLINNAGFGIYDRFQESTLEEEIALVNLSVIAPLILSHELVKIMRLSPNSLIINIGSLAGWLGASTYSAAKSWTKVFSEALSFDLRNSDVKVCCVAPGYLATNFHESAGNSISTIPQRFVSDPRDIARKSLLKARKGKLIYVPTFTYSLIALVLQMLPRPIIRRLSKLR
jgi:short-subunit dehydrogenase